MIVRVEERGGKERERERERTVKVSKT